MFKYAKKIIAALALAVSLFDPFTFANIQAEHTPANNYPNTLNNDEKFCDFSLAKEDWFIERVNTFVKMTTELLANLEIRTGKTCGMHSKLLLNTYNQLRTILKKGQVSSTDQIDLQWFESLKKEMKAISKTLALIESSNSLYKKVHFIPSPYQQKMANEIQKIVALPDDLVLISTNNFHGGYVGIHKGQKFLALPQTRDENELKFVAYHEFGHLKSKDVEGSEKKIRQFDGETYTKGQMIHEFEQQHPKTAAHHKLVQQYIILALQKLDDAKSETAKKLLNTVSSSIDKYLLKRKIQNIEDENPIKACSIISCPKIEPSTIRPLNAISSNSKNILNHLTKIITSCTLKQDEQAKEFIEGLIGGAQESHADIFAVNQLIQQHNIDPVLQMIYEWGTTGNMLESVHSDPHPSYADRALTMAGCLISHGIDINEALHEWEHYGTCKNIHTTKAVSFGCDNQVEGDFVNGYKTWQKEQYAKQYQIWLNYEFPTRNRNDLMYELMQLASQKEWYPNLANKEEQLHMYNFFRLEQQLPTIESLSQIDKEWLEKTIDHHWKKEERLTYYFSRLNKYIHVADHITTFNERFYLYNYLRQEYNLPIADSSIDIDTIWLKNIMADDWKKKKKADWSTRNTTKEHQISELLVGILSKDKEEASNSYNLLQELLDSETSNSHYKIAEWFQQHLAKP